ncbi:MAG: hypothetical protein L6U99_07310 [Clostridium sp.]|nr:MAG: hypothetical protein L6U99_07310 [Clostridium sp.]
MIHIFLDSSIDSVDDSYYYYNKGLLGNIKVEKTRLLGNMLLIIRP